MSLTDTEDEQAWRLKSLHYLGNRVPLIISPTATRRDLDQLRMQLEAARLWVDKIEDQRMRVECEGWCSYSDAMIAKAERTCD